MADENLLATLEGSLRQTRATRARLASRLLELEREADKLRTEIAEMDHIAGQTESAMVRLMTSMMTTRDMAPNAAPHTRGYDPVGGYNRISPSDAQIEAALREDQARSEQARNEEAGGYGIGINAPTRVHQPVAPTPVRPAPRAEVELQGDRFLDRTIPQATALLLRESGAPLHVNEIYNRLLEGGFQFAGQNPTISIAVSLNRNRRFRKVAPGTFDLMIRDAAQAS